MIQSEKITKNDTKNVLKNRKSFVEFILSGNFMKTNSISNFKMMIIIFLMIYIIIGIINYIII